jgi:hypothetical protein
MLMLALDRIRILLLKHKKLFRLQAHDLRRRMHLHWRRRALVLQLKSALAQYKSVLSPVAMPQKVVMFRLHSLHSP